MMVQGGVSNHKFDTPPLLCINWQNPNIEDKNSEILCIRVLKITTSSVIMVVESL